MASKVMEDSVLPETLKPLLFVLRNIINIKQNVAIRQNVTRMPTVSNQNQIRDTTVNVSQASVEMEFKAVSPQTNVILLLLTLVTRMLNVFMDMLNKPTFVSVSKDSVEMVLDALLMHKQQHVIKNQISATTMLNAPLM